MKKYIKSVTSFVLLSILMVNQISALTSEELESQLNKKPAYMSKELFYGLLELEEAYKINDKVVPVNEILTSFPLDQDIFEKNGTIVIKTPSNLLDDKGYTAWTEAGEELGKILDNKIVNSKNEPIGTVTKNGNVYTIVKRGITYNNCSITEEYRYAGYSILGDGRLINNTSFSIDFWGGSKVSNYTYDVNSERKTMIDKTLQVFSGSGYPKEVSTVEHENYYKNGIKSALESKFGESPTGAIYTYDDAFVNQLYDKAVVLQPMTYNSSGLIKLTHSSGAYYFTLNIPSIARQEGPKPPHPLPIKPIVKDVALDKISQRYTLDELGIEFMPLRTKFISWNTPFGAHSSTTYTPWENLLTGETGVTENTIWCNESSWYDPNYYVEWTLQRNDTDPLVVAKNQDKFKFAYLDNSFNTTFTSNPTTVLPANLYSVIYRGNDKITLSTYKNSVAVKNDLSTLGFKVSNTPQDVRATETYEKSTGAMQFGLNSTSDLTISKRCSLGHVHYGSIGPDLVPTYSADVIVDVIRGQQNTTNLAPTSTNSTSIVSNGKTITNIDGSGSKIGDFTFYPYTRMLYDTISTLNNSAYVVSQESSTLPMNSYLEVGWVNDNPLSLRIESDQFSSHAKIPSSYKNKTLPGGAIFKISTTSPSYVGVVSYQMFIEDSLRTGYSIAGFNDDTAKIAHDGAVADVRTEIDNTMLQMKVNSSPSGSILTGVNAIKGTKFSPNGNTLNIDNKYWFQPATGTKNTEGDLDIVRELNKETVYKVYSDADGNIKVSRDAVDIVTWGPTITIAQIDTAVQANAELRELDNKTKVISNFIRSIDRKTGYYEAWDGISVLKSETLLQVGLATPATRIAILDPKLVPSSDSAKDIFTKFYGFGFVLQSKTIESELNGARVNLLNMENIQVSDKYYIPNATVLDLD